MKIIINGAAGAMGLELRRLLEVRYADGEVAALVDSRGGENVYTGFSQVPEVQGTVLDFSFHTATRAAVDYAVSHKLPLVVGTTGHTEEERAHILAAAQQVPLFYSGNMSLGIAVLCRLVKDAVRFFPQADVEILEVHHNRKVDAPSGTALMLAEAVRSQRTEAAVHCGRSGACQAGSRGDRHLLRASGQHRGHSRGDDLHRHPDPHPEARGPRPCPPGPGCTGRRRLPSG